MRFTNKFKATSLIALALVLGACSGGEFSSSTSNSISSFSSSDNSSSSSSSIATFTITWHNYDGTTLETDTNVPYGTTPSFNKSNPTKPSTNDYDFSFIGWLPEITPVTEDVTYVAQFTENLNYIPITNAQELSNIRNNLSGNYRLMIDIDLESVEWEPIGSGTTPFSGTFNGNEFTISNLTITQTQAYVGLFANNSGTIKNLKLGNVQINVTGSISSFIYAGSLVANNTGTIENIETLSGSLFARARGGNFGYVGGIVGDHNNDIIINGLKNHIDVMSEGGTSTSGILGRIDSDTTIKNSINPGDVIGSQKVGGLVGNGKTIDIIDSINEGSVNGISEVGGLVGSGNNGSLFTITNSLNSGSVSGTSNLGGLIGSGHTTTILNSLNSGSVSSTSEIVGGLIGRGFTTTILNSLNSGNVSGSYYVGGLIGYGDSTTTITDSINNGTISCYPSIDASSPTGYVGGLIGYGNSNINTIITNSSNNGNVIGTANVGGLIGLGTNVVTIIKSINSGSVSGSISAVGGLIGGALAGVNPITITNSMNSGSVSGSQHVGGLIGWRTGVNPITITNSMNSGSVSGTWNVGGLIGYAENQLFVYYSVNLGNVVATNTTTAVGGIAGSLPATNDFEDAYHHGSITSNGVAVDGIAFGTKVTDISTFNLAFFTTTLGWDTEVWDFTVLDIANGVYPTLKNMPVVEE